jgi:hypothetical protein
MKTIFTYIYIYETVQTKRPNHYQHVILQQDTTIVITTLMISSHTSFTITLLSFWGSSWKAFDLIEWWNTLASVYDSLCLIYMCVRKCACKGRHKIHPALALRTLRSVMFKVTEKDYNNWVCTNKKYINVQYHNLSNSFIVCIATTQEQNTYCIWELLLVGITSIKVTVTTSLRLDQDIVTCNFCTCKIRFLIIFLPFLECHQYTILKWPTTKYST